MDGKSVISSSSKAFKNEFSVQTIVNKIEKDMQDIINDVPSRVHKNKLQSINETLKILYKKVNSVSVGGPTISQGLGADSAIVSGEINKLKDEIENLKKAHESSILKLISAHNEVLSEKSMERDEMEKNFTIKLEKMTNLYNDERNANNQLNKQIKTLEETLKTVNFEYKAIVDKYEKLEEKELNLEVQHNELKRLYHEGKNKINDLKKVNAELKQKIVESDNAQRLQSEDFKTFVRKHVNLQRKSEENEKERAKMYTDLCYKEERLKALRFMNSKLEHKSKEIMDQWKKVTDFQGKVTELSEENKIVLTEIERLRIQISDLTEENMRLRSGNFEPVSKGEEYCPSDRVFTGSNKSINKEQSTENIAQPEKLLVNNKR